MATSRTTLFLLGLVVLATVCSAAEATTCSRCGSGSAPFALKLDVNLRKCEPALVVQVVDVVKVDQGKALQLCEGGKVTALAPLVLHLKVEGVVLVKLEVLGKKRKSVLTAVVKLDLVKLAVKLVGGVYHVVLDVVVDAQQEQLLFLCLGVQVHAIDIRAYLEVFGLLGVDIGIGLGP